MIRRPTWILLGIFVVLIAATFFWQRSGKQVTAEPTVTPQIPLLPGLEVTQIKAIKIQDQAGQVVLIEKNASDEWELTTPQGLIEDQTRVDSPLDSFLTLRAINVLAAPPPEQATGLATPAYTISLTQEDGRLTKINIGGATATDSGYYVQTGEGSVYVVGKFGVDGLVDLLKNPPLPATATPMETPYPEPGEGTQPILTATPTAIP